MSHKPYLLICTKKSARIRKPWRLNSSITYSNLMAPTLYLPGQHTISLSWSRFQLILPTSRWLNSLGSKKMSHRNHGSAFTSSSGTGWRSTLWKVMLIWWNTGCTFCQHTFGLTKMILWSWYTVKRVAWLQRCLAIARMRVSEKQTMGRIDLCRHLGCFHKSLILRMQSWLTASSMC